MRTKIERIQALGIFFARKEGEGVTHQCHFYTTTTTTTAHASKFIDGVARLRLATLIFQGALGNSYVLPQKRRSHYRRTLTKVNFKVLVKGKFYRHYDLEKTALRTSFKV